MHTLWIRIGLVLFVSGFCSLVYQVAWLRLLRLIFGVSTASSAAVVAIFMGGLGLGGYLFGRRVRRLANPMAFYARLELGIALTAAVSPLLVLLARYLYIALGGVNALGMPAATVLRLVLATLVLGASTTLMGGTLPAVAQAMRLRADLGRRYVAWLYGINTLGAVVGAFLTNFVLLELVGIRRSLWLASLVNLLLAMAVRQLARREEFSRAGDSGDAAAAREDAAPAEADAGPAPSSRLVLPAAGIVGAIFFLMELVWYRMLAPVLGGSSYTFGLILAVALLGIGAGGLLYAVGSRERRPSLLALATTCVLEAFFLALPFALGDHLALFAAAIRPLAAFGFGGLVLSWAVVAGIVVLPAAVVSGYQFPLLVALLGSDARRAGYEVGLIYAWNTWGAILGSLAGGFGLLPLLSAPRLWVLSAGLLLVLAAAAAWADGAARRRGFRLAALAAGWAITLGLCFTPGPTAFWRHIPIGAGRATLDFQDPNRVRGAVHDARLSLFREAEGVESSVALMGRTDLALIVNGKSDGSSQVDAPTMVMSGLIGALLHPEPKHSLVIGLGTGTTAGWLAEVETMQRVDVVELEPAVVGFAADYAPINRDVMASPKVELYLGDGREVVLTGSQSWDLVFSEPSNPYRAGVADLFSQDFYRSVRQRLAPGGIFLQWLQGYEVDARLVQTVYTTLSSTFPHLETWQVHATDLLLVAANEPLVHDLDRIRARVDRHPFRAGLRRTWRVEGIEGFYSGYIGGTGLAAGLAQAASVVPSTDDRPTIEFGFAKNAGRTGLFRLHDVQRLAHYFEAQRPQVTGAPLDWSRVDRERHARAAVATAVYDGASASSPSPEQLLRFAARQAWGRGNLKEAGRSWFEQQEGPQTWLDTMLLAEVLADRGDAAAEPYLERLRQQAPTEAEAVAARLAWRRADPAGAGEHLLATVERCRGDAFFYSPLIERTLSLIPRAVEVAPQLGERFFAALGEPFACRHLERDRLLLRVRLAGKLGSTELCVEAFAAFEPDPVWERAFLEGRLDCYERAGHPRAGAARDDLDDYAAAAPPELEVGGR